MAEIGGCRISPPAAAEEEEEEVSWMCLDNEDDPSRQIKPAPPAKRGRGKLILLEDILKEKKKRLSMDEQTSKRAVEAQDDSSDSSDEDYSCAEHDENFENVDVKLDKISRLIAGGESEVQVKWGERVFGPCKSFPEFTVPENDTGLIARILKFEPQEGAGKMSTAASMSVSGLLLSWAVLERQCDRTTARWLFHQMAYSNSVCREKDPPTVLRDLFIRETMDGKPVCKLEWLPSFEDIKETFRTYGYLDAGDEDDEQSAEPFEKTGRLLHSERFSAGLNNRRPDLPSEGEDTLVYPKERDSRDGPPANIRPLLQFLVPYFQSRKWYCPLLTSEAESLVVLLVRCQLDRCMLNASNLLGSCFEALIYYFTEEEWTFCSERIASSISRVSPTFVNNLRVAKSLHGMNNRFRSLQRLVVLQLLSRRVEAKRCLSSPEDVVSIFKSVNPKDGMGNFLNLHHLLILADIFLWLDGSFTKTRKPLAAWLDVLKKCSTHIPRQDPRPDAIKVRTWAAFLCQKYQIEKMQKSSIAQ